MDIPLTPILSLLLNGVQCGTDRWPFTVLGSGVKRMRSWVLSLVTRDTEDTPYSDTRESDPRDPLIDP